VKRQCIHTLLPLDGVNANHRCFAGEFDRPDNRIELRNIEIMLELIARFPFFNEQKRFSFIKGPRDNQAPPVSAQELIQVFAAMLFAPGWRDDNLFLGIDRFKRGTHHTWTEGELKTFETKWPLGTRQRLAYSLLLYTGHVSGMLPR
jgi:hypothetical protein